MTREQLKILQSKKRINNRQLAIVLGVSLGAVKKWRSGERRISKRTTKHLEVYFELLDLYVDKQLEFDSAICRKDFIKKYMNEVLGEEKINKIAIRKSSRMKIN